MWRYRYFFVFVFYFAATGLARAQIFGNVLAPDKTPLMGVTVLALNPADSAYISATVTDTSGHFLIKDLKSNPYIVSFSLVGYKKRILRMDTRLPNARFFTVILDEELQVLQGLTITGQRTAFSYEGGKTTVNLASAVAGSDGTMLDALKKIPGVLIQNDGTILLNGQPGANIMIDDKQTYLSGENLVNYLRSIPVSSVDKLELISQPSSSYDAAGTAGLINIQRKKKQAPGLNLTATSSLEHGKKGRTNQSMSLIYHRNKSSLYADYSFNAGRNFIDITSTRDYIAIQQTSLTGLQLAMKANRQQLQQSHYLKSGIDYAFSKKLTGGAFLSANWFNRTKQEQVISDLYGLYPRKDSSIHTRNIQHFYHNNLSGEASLDYKPNDKLNWNAALNVQHFGQGDNLDQTSMLDQAHVISRPDTLLGSTTGTVKIFTAQTNISYHFSNQLKLTAGLKSASVQINSDAVYRRRLEGQWRQDDRLSSAFLYHEHINAGYWQLNKKWAPAFSTDMGIRLEHTRISGQFASNDKTSGIHRNYLNLFPSFQANYKLSDNHQFFLQYGRRIVRPNYRDLNPFVEVNDRYLQEKGNPRLNPEMIDNLESTWLIRQKYVISLFYLNRKNPITRSFLPDDSSYTTTVLPLNLSGSYTMGGRMNINNLKPFPFWTVHLNLALTYKKFQWLEVGSLYKNTLLTPTLQWTNQFSLPRHWSMDVTGYYTGRLAEGQAKTGALSVVSLGVRKTLFKNKFALYLYVNDIFLTNRPGMTITNSLMQGYYRERRDTRMIGLSLTYRFKTGDFTKEIRRTGSSDEEKRINLP